MHKVNRTELDFLPFMDIICILSVIYDLKMIGACHKCQTHARVHSYKKKTVNFPKC